MPRVEKEGITIGTLTLAVPEMAWKFSNLHYHTSKNQKSLNKNLKIPFFSGNHRLWSGFPGCLDHHNYSFRML